MKRILVGALLLFSFSLTSGVSFAADEKRVEIIKELLEANDALAQIRAMRDLIPQEIEGQLAISGMQLSVEQKQILADVVLEEYIKLEKDMIALIISLYDQNFSDDELSALVDFYNSDTGKKMTERLPAMMAQIMAATNQMVVQIMPEIQRKIAERFNELEQEGTS